MSIIDTLITDRTQADVTKLKSLLSKPKAMWTNEEWSEFILAKDKGAYNATDLNRVQEAMEYLAERFRGYGYNVPEIKRPSITEVIPGTSKLPEGYTELEYIESTGEQFVDTGISVPHATARIVVDFAPTSVTGDHKSITGHTNTTFNWATNFLFINGSTSTITLNGVDAGIVASVGNRYVVDYNQASYSINGGDHVSTTRSFTDGYNDTIFYSSGKYGEFKLYSYRLYNDSTLVRDYVPCLNPSNEVGLYDSVNGVFYGNAGTSYFLPGPVVSLPEGYTKLTYIESTGTQYIDTGVMPNQNTRVVADVYTESTSAIKGIFGSRSSGTLNGFCVWQLSNTSVGSYYGTLNNVVSMSTVGVRILIDKNKNITTVNGTETSANTQTFTGLMSVHLFTVKQADGTFPYAHMVGKFYSCQIWDNGTLIRDLAPCKNPDGEIGLYDTITGKFFGNAGDGAFVAGEELEGSGDAPTQIIERDYWEIGDIPRKEQMDLYLTNLGYVKNVLGLLKSTPESPYTMDYLSYVEANNIEQILVDIEFVITHTIQSMARLNAFMFVSGYRPFPSSASDYGRTWDDIDALELNWDDLDDGEAWYTMQYGVIK